MIVADNDVHPKELETMYRIGTEFYGLTPEEINEAVLSGGTAFYKPDTEEERIAYLYDLALIAWADGVLQDEEKVLLREYALKFDVDENVVDEFLDQLLAYAKKELPINDVLNKFANQ